MNKLSLCCKQLANKHLCGPGRHKPLIINTLYNLFFNFKLYNFLVFSIYLVFIYYVVVLYLAYVYLWSGVVYLGCVRKNGASGTRAKNNCKDYYE